MKALVTSSFSLNGLAMLRDYLDVEIGGWCSGAAPLSKSALLFKIPEIDILISEYEKVDREIINAASRLKIIASPLKNPRANIDIDYAKAKGIVCLCSLGSDTQAAAEMTLALMLAAARRIKQSALFAASNPGYAGASDFEGSELMSKTLGLVGFGRTGQKVCAIAKAFGMNVMAYDPFVTRDRVTKAGAKLAGMPELFAASDFISLHCGRTQQTEGFIGAPLLGRMKKSAWLINVSFPEVVDENELHEHLVNRRIAGAALDGVTATAKGRAIAALDNALITPGIARATSDITDRNSEALSKGIIDYIEGRRPQCLL
ncbi:MAG: NAD(P)-dependent oxidoreductase [Christensenellales bacterium]|jgi:D-3-phosphoglycerate dehydrogenase